MSAALAQLNSSAEQQIELDPLKSLEIPELVIPDMPIVPEIDEDPIVQEQRQVELKEVPRP